MHKRITFRSMAHSDAIEKYIYKKLEKIDKFFKREPLPICIDIILEPHREKHFFKVEFKVNSVNYHIIVQSEGLDMYMMIDDVVHKMVKEMTKKKEKFGYGLHVSYSI